MEANSAINYTNVFKETLEVLNHFDSEFLSKIPNEFLNAMKELSVDVIFIIVVSVLVILFEEYL